MSLISPDLREPSGVWQEVVQQEYSRTFLQFEGILNDIQPFDCLENILRKV